MTRSSSCLHELITSISRPYRASRFILLLRMTKFRSTMTARFTLHASVDNAVQQFLCRSVVVPGSSWYVIAARQCSTLPASNRRLPRFIMRCEFSCFLMHFFPLSLFPLLLCVLKMLSCFSLVLSSAYFVSDSRRGLVLPAMLLRRRKHAF